MAEKKLFIICGEASGDLQAAGLAQKILALNPQVKICAVAGNLLREAGAEIIYDIKDLSVIGVFDVLKKLPKFIALKKLILENLRANKPDALIFVDFSGFNLRLARAVNKSIPCIYYISPQVWASRRGRIKTIKKYIDKLIVLFKFEVEFYKNYGIDVDFVGHPLLDIVKPSMEKKEFRSKLGLDETKTTLVLLAGSRQAEVKKILPVMLETVWLISREIAEIQIVIAKSLQVDLHIYNHIVSLSGVEVKIVEGKTYDALNIADFALVASGTATLEAAIIQVPFVIIYKMGLLNYLVYRPQVRLPYIGMVNIVAGKLVVPEFIQFRANPQEIATVVIQTLKSPAKIEQIKHDLAAVKSSLGEKGASLRAAQIILHQVQS